MRACGVRLPGCRASLCMQDVNTALVGVAALLQLMSQPTGPLLEAHRAARRAALLTCSSAAGLDASSPAATGGSPRRGAQHQQPGSSKLGPLAARLKPAASLPLAGMSGSGGSLTPQLTGASAVCVLETGRTGGGSGSSSPRGGLGGGWAAAGTRHSSTAALVAAGGDVGSSEPILLRVLCHRWLARAHGAASFCARAAPCCTGSRSYTLDLARLRAAPLLCWHVLWRAAAASGPTMRPANISRRRRACPSHATRRLERRSAASPALPGPECCAHQCSMQRRV